MKKLIFANREWLKYRYYLLSKTFWAKMHGYAATVHDYLLRVYKSKRADGTSTPAVRKMRIDSKTSWLSACRRAGIEDFRFHDLRHTWASWLIQSGVPLSVLQEMGGWESIEMVRRYAHLAPNHLTEHARKIDDIFGDNVPNMSHSGIMEDIKKA